MIKEDSDHNFIFESFLLITMFTHFIFWVLYALNRTNFVFLLVVIIVSVTFTITMLLFFNKFEKLKKQVIRDSMTQIYNWKFIRDSIDIEIERSKRLNKKFGIIHFDIDDFKKINDTYGHNIGDDVLIKLVEVVETVIRPYDIFGRLGGEEFSVILPEIDEKYLLIISERIRKKIEEVTVNDKIKITISLGVTLVQENDDYYSVYERVDKAMYLAKEAGKNNIKFI